MEEPNRRHWGALLGELCTAAYNRFELLVLLLPKSSLVKIKTNIATPLKIVESNVNLDALYILLGNLGEYQNVLYLGMNFYYLLQKMGRFVLLIWLV
jgi:hypothetical protein